ncbi:dolichol-phosphate mannosyltransferase [Sphingomonas sp. OV641]|uniref:glycosyltransferase family 2 protein n=1 Tax=Sphingomonas sp. OV641 TaxID=1881068 RepID=UPI0008B9AAEE|nr:glycosyltransferase family 2 protein [Sphingomonas sp. OV641]SEI83182.1 dolichol-phosphate mannosyltransferase [Sphingomonas sp. OV641]
MNDPTLVSILVPAFNEEDNAEKAYNAIVAVFDRLPDYACEIIFTDNHSTDRTFPILRELATRDPRVRVIRFARNYGYQRSLLVAYQNARGACSVQIDCDLQDSPEHIPQMLSLWRQGHQVVYGIRRTLADPPAVAAARRLFYRGLSAMSDDDLPIDAGEFRLVDARILAELRSVRDTSPYLRGMISSMGFSQVGFAYDRAARTAGESKFPMRKMVSLAMDGLLNHSLVPLRMASGIGIAVGVVTILLMVGYLIGRLIFGQQWPAGFATTTILLLLGITLNALFLGIIGEYLGRMFLEIKGRPAPIVEAQLNGAGPLSLDFEIVPLRQAPGA